MAADDVIKQMRNYPELTLRLSFYEIYGTKLLDLLNGK